jgi:hypothetical protein
MREGRVPGRRKDLDGAVIPTLLAGEYGTLNGFWCLCPPSGYPSAVDVVTEHEDGTITAEVEQLGQRHRIVRGVWEPPTPA